MTEELERESKPDLMKSGPEVAQPPVAQVPEKLKRRLQLSRKRWEAIKQKARQADEYLDLLQRSRAEFDNYRKRINREKAEIVRAAQGDIALDFLPVLDNLERALVAAEGNAEGNLFLRGLKMIRKEFVETFARRGIVPIEAVGKAFNPEEHEAIERVETAEYPSNTVIKEMRRGYRMADRVLRPGAVSVAIAPAGAEAAPGQQVQVGGLPLLGQGAGSKEAPAAARDSDQGKEGGKDG